MTPDTPRAAAEAWLAAELKAAFSLAVPIRVARNPREDQLTPEQVAACWQACARIAADFAERLAMAKVHPCRGCECDPHDYTLPWAAAMEEEK
jgi:hypothetical protein